MTVEQLEPGVYRVEDAGRSEIVYVAGAPGDLWAWWNGQLFRQRDHEPAAEAGVATAGPVPPMTAPMPGTVLKVSTAPGARVAKGDTLIVLEAMKMELPLRALDDAIVAQVRCREGELVAAEAVLVEFEE